MSEMDDGGGAVAICCLACNKGLPIVLTADKTIS
jgi:hypothetical protein